MTTIDIYTPGSRKTTEFGVVTYSTPTQKFERRVKSALVVTSQHAKRKKEPHIWLPPTPFNASLRIIDYGRGVFRYSNYREEGTAPYGNPTPSTDLLAQANLDLRNRAVIRALAKLKEQDVNYAQAFAEWGQTSRLVASSATRIAGMYHYLREGNLRKAADALGVNWSRKKNSSILERGMTKKNTAALADGVLELNYGWKPLLSDCYGSVKDFADQNNLSPTRFRVTVRATASEKTDTGIQILRSGDWEGKCRLEMTRSSRVRLDYYMVNPVLAAWTSAGLTNPLTLAWELTPWSFVADWFYPLGGMLNSLDAANGYSFLGGSCTDRNVGLGSVYRTDVWSATSIKGSWCEGKYDSRKVVTRIVYASSPLPRFPGFKNPFSTTHVVNALALLRGSVR